MREVSQILRITATNIVLRDASLDVVRQCVPEPEPVEDTRT